MNISKNRVFRLIQVHITPSFNIKTDILDEFFVIAYIDPFYYIVKEWDSNWCPLVEHISTNIL